MNKGSCFSKSSPTLFIISFLLYIHHTLVCMKWYFIVVLICVSLISADTESFFVCLFAYWHIFLDILFKEKSIQILKYFKNYSIHLIVIELKEFFIYSRCKFCIRCVNCRYFLLWIIFLLFYVIWSTKVFNFDEFQFINFFFYHLYFCYCIR